MVQEFVGVAAHLAAAVHEATARPGNLTARPVKTVVRDNYVASLPNFLESRPEPMLQVGFAVRARPRAKAALMWGSSMPNDDAPKRLTADGAPMVKDSRITAIIVEDELASRERLKRLLTRYEQRVELVGEADQGNAAVELANRLRPDMLFLDVSLPGIDGFDVIHQIPSQTRVIFTTAHEEHAVRAFRTDAVDYLLKPIDPAQLEVAIARVAEALADRGDVVRLLCRDRDKTFVIDAADVLFLRAEDGYTHVQTRNSYYLTGESLALFEKQLASTFVRVHRNTLVNVRHVLELRHSDGELVAVLASEHEIPVSRRHSQEFRRRLAYNP